MILLSKDLFPNEFKRCPQFMSNHKNILIDEETLLAANIRVDTVIQKPGDRKKLLRILYINLDYYR